MRVIIIGGGAAGTACALALRKIDKEAAICIIDQSPMIGYSPCALPYALSREIRSVNDIVVFDRKTYADNGIELMLNARVKRIDRAHRSVVLSRGMKRPYDRLVIATGSSSFLPPLPGLDASHSLTFTSITDLKRIEPMVRPGKRAAVLGAGLIGLEVACALHKRRMRVTLIEAQNHILPALFDSDLAARIRERLQDEGIEILTAASVKGADKGRVMLTPGSVACTVLVICAGIRPNIKLATDAGLRVGRGIRVDKEMRTSDKSILACGDCAEVQGMVNGQWIVSALGTTAVRQAAVAAATIAGKKKHFPPVLNATVSKLGSFFIGCVGLTEHAAHELGITTVSGNYTGSATAAYYSDSSMIAVKLVADIKGRLLGGQLMSTENLAGRIDALSIALSKKMSIADLTAAETCYNPASAPLYDPVTIAAEACTRKLAHQKKQRDR